VIRGRTLQLATRIKTYCYNGKFEEYNLDNEKISSYLERVELFMTANGVAEDKQVAVLLSVIWAKIYSLLRDLLSPTNPKEKSLDQLSQTLKNHFEPKPLVIAERFTFYRRDQFTDESILQYVAELRRLAAHCKFEGFLDQALRDRLVCGLQNEGIQKRLLTEADLTLARAVEVAQGMEAAQVNANLMKGKPSEAENISKVTHEYKPSNSFQNPAQPWKKPCYRCGKQGHAPSDCTFRNSPCHQCGKIGHIA